MASNTIPNLLDPTNPLVLINLSNCDKLTPLNYITWQTQIESILFGYDLLKYVHGTYLQPSETVLDPKATKEEPTILPNPAHSTWQRQDRLIIGAIIGTLSPTIAPLVVRAKTSHEAWTILSNTYANPSRGHILHLKDRLNSISKTNQSVTEYLLAIKICTDQLALMGKPMDHEDILAKILDGLDYETYRPVIEAVRHRDTPITFEALHEKLLHHDLRTKPQPTANPFPPSAHAITHKPYHNRHTPSSSRTIPPANSPSTDDRPPNQFYGRCQWCRYKGHVIADCRQFRKLCPNLVFPPPNTTYRQQTSRSAPHAHTATTGPPSPSAWLLDSGATHHVTNDLTNLSLHHPYDGTDELIIGDGSSLPITHIGSFSISTPFATLHFNNVLYVPLISRNILSISQFCLDNYSVVQFSPHSFSIKALTSGNTLLQGPIKSGAYEWTPLQPSAHLAALSKPDWHHILGHPAPPILKLISSIFPFNYSSNHLCNSCNINKSHKLPFNLSTLTSTAPLELIFSDVWTVPIHSYDNYKYYIIFVDHFTKYIWLYPLKRKSDSYQTFLRFRNIVEKFFNTSIITIFSDNGGEYLKMDSTVLYSGITHLTSPPHTPEHNGYAEQRHRHLVETGLSLLSHAHLPPTLWPFALTTAAYLINRLPTPTLKNTSTYHCLFKTQPNYSKLRSFGCLCYPWLRPYTKHKLDPKSTPCIFVGYSSTQSAYHCLDPTTNRLYTSRHVKFIPDTYPYPTLVQTVQFTPTITPSDWFHELIPTNNTTNSHDQPTPPTPTPHSAPVIPSPVNSPVQDPPTPETSISSTPISPNAAPQPTRTITTRLSNNIRKPNPKYAHLAQLDSKHHTPTTVKQALVQPHWRQAMQEEYDALTRNNTWTLTPHTTTYNVVGCKWVFRIKYHQDGTIKQYKARLVAKGFHQRPGIDFVETFSPVIKPTTIRLLLSLAVTHGWPLRQLDINNAFLQGTLSDTVYMTQPPGFVDSTSPTHVCRLSKAIYGLKQAPRAWYTELKTFLTTLGFTPCISDSSLFILHHDRHPLYVLVYVDDIIVTGPSQPHLTTFITTISNRFSLKDLGPLSLFLGIEVVPTPQGLHLNQSKYTYDLLCKYNMQDSKPSSTPMSVHPPLTSHDGTPIHNVTDYRALVGSLQYLTLTRPDIAYTVNKLAQYMQHPHNHHWNALKRLLRYLHGTLTVGLQLHRQNPLRLHAFCDADWAGDKDDYISTTGYIVYLGRTPISWTSRKQRALSRSSTEAEFRAVADTCAEMLWVQSLLTELGLKLPHQPTIYCDNLSATHYSANPVFHSRMKHLALAFHFVREQVHQGKLRVQHISGDDQLADALTKPLPKLRLSRLLSKIGLRSPSSILRGNVRQNNTSS